jgi:hypothetical protein
MRIRRTMRDRTKYGCPTGKHALLARLVESVRVDGKPRQRTLCYLGSIYEDWRESHVHMVCFWRRASVNLAKLNLEQKVRDKIEKDLEAKVAKPDENGLERFRALFCELESGIQGNQRQA